MRARYPTVGRDVGRILQAVSLMLVASVLVAVGTREFFAVPAFVVSAVAMGGTGTALARRYGGAPPAGKLEAMITAASAWALIGVLGGLPFLLVAWSIALDPFPAWANAPPMDDTTVIFLHPLDAVFESVSGFTGTGLTVAAIEEELPRSLHWWRSFTEWIGGVGVIVLTVAILARPGSGSFTLYESEARSEKIHPSIVATVKEIWKIYPGLTLASIGLFLAVGMPPWDAINHGMTGIATGGFSVHAASIGHYGSPLIEYAVVPVMVAGSIAFPVHYLIVNGELELLRGYPDPMGVPLVRNRIGRADPDPGAQRAVRDARGELPTRCSSSSPPRRTPASGRRRSATARTGSGRPARRW